MSLIQLKYTTLGTVPTDLAEGEPYLDIKNNLLYWRDVAGAIHAVPLETNVASGLAALDNTGKVPISILPLNLFGALTIQGTWNASTNSPALTSGVGSKGAYYVVSVAGATSLDGISEWQPGDMAIFNGTVWQKAFGGGTLVFQEIDASAIAATGSLRANTANKLLTPNAVWADATPVAIPYNASLVLDFSTFLNASIALTGNLSITGIVNAKKGQSGIIELPQSVNNCTLSLSTNFVMSNSVAPVLSGFSGANDLLAYQVLNIGGGSVFVNLIKSVWHP